MASAYKGWFSLISSTIS